MTASAGGCDAGGIRSASGLGVAGSGEQARRGWESSASGCVQCGDGGNGGGGAENFGSLPAFVLLLARGT
jgi:hypothetical protein